MGTTDLQVLAALTALEVEYWLDVDHGWGRGASALYVSDGLFAIGDKKMVGQAAIADFYRWREGRGERTARHVVTNFHLKRIEGNRAQFTCIMALYAADGTPVLESRPPIMLADVVNECETDADGRWRYVSHELRPVFMGGESPTIPPDPAS